jgi:nucleotide-binding universal stress UspA family protein
MTADGMHILLPVIDPSRARAALPVARTMAEMLNASLHVLASGARPPAARELAGRLSTSAEALDGAAIESAAGDLVEDMARRVDGWQSAMLVLAARLGGRGAEDEAQTIERRALESIPCPILIVPPEKDMRDWRLKRELLPQDGTPGCAAALAQIVNRSRRRGVESLVLRVAGAKVDQPTEPGSLAMPRYVDHPQYEWEAWGEEFLGRICAMGAKPGEAGLKLLVATGEPAAAILRVAKEEAVDMIVLPWHCALGPGRARMIKAVLRKASCPVLLLPEERGRCEA